jgi:hypothetical protein
VLGSDVVCGCFHAPHATSARDALQ